MNIEEFRTTYPQYDDLSDDELSDRLYQRHYSDMPRAEFDSKFRGPVSDRPQIEQSEATNPVSRFLDETLGTPSQDGYSQLASGAAGFGSGFTSGLIGRFMALPAYLTNETFAEKYKDIRNRMRAARLDNPNTYLAGEIGGGITQAALAAPAAGTLASATGISRLPRWAQLGGLGAAEGALYNAATGELGEEGQNALVGGLVGGATGLAAPPIIRGLGAVGSKLKSGLTGQSGAMTRSANKLARALRQDGDTPQEILKRWKEANRIRPGVASLSDVARGPNTRRAIDDAFNRPGPGAAAVEERLLGKLEGAYGRLSVDLRKFTGGNQTRASAIKDVIGRRSAQGSKLYPAAMQEGDRFIWNDTIEQLASDEKYFGKAMRDALEDWRANAVADGYGAMNPTRISKATGNLMKGKKLPAVPNLQFWDYVKRALYKQEKTMARAGDPTAGTLRKLRQSLVRSLDEEVASYAPARNAWAGDSQFLDAIDDGRQLLMRNTDPEQFAMDFAAKSDWEKEGLRIGAVQDIINRMGAPTSAAPPGEQLLNVAKILNSRNVRQNLATIMPDEQAGQAFLQRLDFELQSANTAAQALGNSATARRLAAQTADKDLALDIVMDVASGGGWGPFRFLLKTAPRWMRDRMRERMDKELADLMTDPTKADEIVDFLQWVEIQGMETPMMPQAAGVLAANRAQLGQ